MLGAVLAVATAGVAAAAAGGGESLARDIAKERKARDTGWASSEAHLSMSLFSAGGDKSVRELRLRSLEVAGDGNQSLILFDVPTDVKGTAVLTHSHIYEADDQWLFLPTIKRVKRISSSNKSGAFMGSEFAFEDLSSFEVDKYDYDYLGEEALGVPAYVIGSRPRYQYSGYSRLKTWLDKARYVVLKTEYYDQRGELLKTLIPSEYRQYQGKYWRAMTLTMRNQQTGKATELKFGEYRFGVAQGAEDFSPNILSRVH